MHQANVFTVAAGLLLFGWTAAAAQDRDSVGVVAMLKGEATVRRAALLKPVSLQLRDDVFIRDEIRTQEHSLVRVLLGGKALITMRELSVVTVTEEAGRVTVDLESGKIGVAVIKSRMLPGEHIEVRSPNATAAVRGTVFVVEVDPTTDVRGVPATATHVHLLHGVLDVSVRSDASQMVRLGKLQRVTVTGNQLGQSHPIPQDAVAAITADLEPGRLQRPTAPKEFTEELLAREQDRAVALTIQMLSVPAGAPATTGPSGPAAAAGGGLGGAVGGVVSTLGGSVGGAVSGVGGALGGSVGGAVGSLGGTISGLSGSVGGTIGTLTGPLGGSLSGLGLGGGRWGRGGDGDGEED